MLKPKYKSKCVHSYAWRSKLALSLQLTASLKSKLKPATVFLDVTFAAQYQTMKPSDNKMQAVCNLK